MKIAFISKDDPRDVHAWSGTVNYQLKALLSTGLDVTSFGRLNNQNLIAFTKGFIYGRLVKKTYFREFEPSILKNYAYQVERALALIDHDVVFSSRTFPIAYLRTEKPIVFWHDATVAGMMGFALDTNKYCAETIKNGNKMESLALAKCRLAIYSSEWSADTAIKYYAVDPVKVKVVPFGANIISTRTEQDILALLQVKSFNACRLLFIGKEWFGKGGETAMAVAEQLNQQGIPTELHVVGCDPPANLPGYVKRYGFISKASQEGRMRLDDLYTKSHFFILPSHREAFGIVFAEASSFGLPSLATNVGGIPTVIHDGKNGFTFPLVADPEAYCKTIQRFWSSRTDYERLALSSFREYTQRLNWATAGQKVAKLIQEYCV